MELTEKQKLVLQALSDGGNHGYQICKSTGLLLGSVYNILRKLEEKGLCRHEWKEGTKRYFLIRKHFTTHHHVNPLI